MSITINIYLMPAFLHYPLARYAIRDITGAVHVGRDCTAVLVVQLYTLL